MRIRDVLLAKKKNRESSSWKMVVVLWQMMRRIFPTKLFSVVVSVVMGCEERLER